MKRSILLLLLGLAALGAWQMAERPPPPAPIVPAATTTTTIRRSDRVLRDLVPMKTAPIGTTPVPRPTTTTAPPPPRPMITTTTLPPLRSIPRWRTDPSSTDSPWQRGLSVDELAELAFGPG